VRVLLVEDDASLARSVEIMLRDESISVDLTDLGEDALDVGKLYEYDVILLDLTLPDIDGLEVIRRLRASKISTPILAISGLGKADTVKMAAEAVKTLDAGADDHIAKPFDKREVLSRCRAMTRRNRGHAENIITLGRLTIDMERRDALVDGRSLRLTPKEYAILELLATRRGITVTKEMFLNNVYGGMEEPQLKIIDVFVCKLRRKLSDALGNHDHIETIWGRGYTLMEGSANWKQQKLAS
jgi:two-component system cell cycle response regulator CtrA